MGKVGCRRACQSIGWTDGQGGNEAGSSNYTLQQLLPREDEVTHIMQKNLGCIQLGPQCQQAQNTHKRMRARRSSASGMECQGALNGEGECSNIP